MDGAAGGQGDRPTSSKVLVVGDDLPRNVRPLAAVLTAAGYEVVSAFELAGGPQAGATERE
jgi:hypothetical protein